MKRAKQPSRGKRLLGYKDCSLREADEKASIAEHRASDVAARIVKAKDPKTSTRTHTDH